jgi:glycosyltransferase involved in cell wall biosynthesis
MKVSILINNYNNGRYLDYCIQSALNQTYKNFEIIVYDDGSTDNSLEITNNYKGKIKIISRPNFGKIPAINQANSIYQSFKASEGDIICLLDSDDAFLPSKLEKVVQAFKQDDEAIVVQNKLYGIDEDNNRNGKLYKNILYNINVLKAIYYLNKIEIFFIQTSGLSFRRSYLDKVLPLNNNTYPLIWADVQLTRTAVFYGKIVTLNMPEGEYRVHTSNIAYHNLRNKNFNQDFTRQHYAFFNEVATKNNFPSLRIKNSFMDKLLGYVKIMFLNATPKIKLSYFFNALKPN